MSLTQPAFAEIVLDIIEMNRMVDDGDPANSLERNNKTSSQLVLIQEEFNETYDAIFASDTREIVDGVCDMFVVWSFYHYLMSLRFEGHDANEWANWFSGVEMDCLENGTIIGISPLTKYLEVGDQIIPTDYMGSMMMTIGNIMSKHLAEDFDFEANLRAVSVSNWTKFPSVHDIDDPIDECRRIEDNYRINKGEELEVEFSVRQDQNGVPRYIFTNAKTGKFLKPTSFEKPQLIF